MKDIVKTKTIIPMMKPLNFVMCPIKVLKSTPNSGRIKFKAKHKTKMVINPYCAPFKSGGLSDICVQTPAIKKRNTQNPIVFIFSTTNIVFTTSKDVEKIVCRFNEVIEVTSDVLSKCFANSVYDSGKK